MSVAPWLALPRRAGAVERVVVHAAAAPPRPLLQDPHLDRLRCLVPLPRRHPLHPPLLPLPRPRRPHGGARGEDRAVGAGCAPPHASA
eukprot:512552-Rhodomonas_salina.1